MALVEKIRSGAAAFCNRRGQHPTTVHLTNDQLIALVSELVDTCLRPIDVPESDQPFEFDGMVIRISETPGPHFTDS